MKKATKIWLIAAAVLCLAGAAIIVGALSTADFEFSELSERKTVTNSYEFSEDFESIFVDVETTALTFAFSDDGLCRLECVEDERLKHSVKIQEGSLIIEASSGKWYDYISTGFQEPRITVYLPKTAYSSLSVNTATGDIIIPEGFAFEAVSISGTTSGISFCADVSASIELSTSTGDITLASVQAEAVRLSTTTGKIAVTDASCNKLTATSSTGDTELKNVIAQESIEVESTTGDVEFERCDAAGISVNTSTGSVTGTLLSEKVFITDTSTGDVSVPKSPSGGSCEVTTSTGDIEFEIV